MRETLLSVHLLAVIVWLGFGFCDLWLGRSFRAAAGTAAEAPIGRFLARCGVAIFAATLIAFAAGIAMTHTQGWGWFRETWLGVKQAIMLGVLAGVAVILPRAVRFGRLIDALPPGPGPASPEIRALHHGLVPWFVAMRAGGVVAVLLAVWRP